MVGLGREDKKDNDLFYTCSLIDYISAENEKYSCRCSKSIRQETSGENL